MMQKKNMGFHMSDRRMKLTGIFSGNGWELASVLNFLKPCWKMARASSSSMASKDTRMWSEQVLSVSLMRYLNMVGESEGRNN
nr:hypothetical protein [Tanacetum cinerariifolium]